MSNDIQNLKDEWRAMGLSEEEIAEKEKTIIEISKDKPVLIELSELERNVAIEHIKKKKNLIKSILIMAICSITSGLLFSPIAFYAGFYVKYGLVGLGLLFIFVPHMTYWKKDIIIRIFAFTFYAAAMFQTYIWYDIIAMIDRYGFGKAIEYLSCNYSQFLKWSVKETLNDNMLVVLTSLMGIFVFAFAKGEYDEGDIQRAHKEISPENRQ